MKKRNRRKKMGNVRRLGKKRLSQLENLEHRRLLAGDFPGADIIIGTGNLPRQAEVEAKSTVVEIRATQDINNITIDVDKLNNTQAGAQEIMLGFGDCAAGSSCDAIDLLGVIEDIPNLGISDGKETPPVPAPQNFQPQDDGSIPAANQAFSGSSSTERRFRGVLGDSPLYGTADGDFYEVRDVRATATAPQVLTAYVAGAPNSILVLYDQFGRIKESTEASSEPNYIVHEIDEPGDYYFALFPFDTTSATTDPGDFQAPNAWDASTVQPYTGANQAYTITIGLDSFDIDYYKFTLDAGDILGVNGLGASDVLILEGPGTADPDAQLRLIQTSQDDSTLYPLASPLPGGGAASLAYVIDTPGEYFLNVQAYPRADLLGRDEARYLLELRLFRPAIESQPVGSEQILFLDFDGAEYNPEIIDETVPDLRTLSPLSNFMPALELRDEADLIRRIVREVKQDFDELKAINPNSTIRILNSRDHADPFGQPNVSRIIVGGTLVQAGLPGSFAGVAESVDVGNFDTTETALVLLDSFSGPRNDPSSLNHFKIAPGAKKADLVARAIGRTISHEAAHLFGAFHTEPHNAVNNIVDRGGQTPRAQLIGIGPDLIWGTADDENVSFLDDILSLTEGDTGISNVVGMLAHVLIPGKGTTPDQSFNISGTVFQDDGNGVRDVVSEPGLAGVRVYIDINGDKEFGITEPSTLTDGSGNYRLTDFPASDVEIRIVVAPGQRQTFPLDGNGHLVKAGSTDLDGLDFGLTATSTETDFGDAPATYGVASHQVLSGFSLGATVDGEANPVFDDSDGDDGIPDAGELQRLVAGQSGAVTIETSDFSPGVLNSWIDFDGNGQFTSDEQVVQNRQIVRNQGGGPTTTVVTFAVPAGAAGDTWARFRYGYTRDIGPDGAGNEGEVEDYRVKIVPPGQTQPDPMAGDDAFTIAQGSTNNSLNVLSNDIPRSDISLLSVQSPTNANGTVNIASGGQSLTYTPPLNFSGTDSFTYTIASTSSAKTASATVTVNVGPVVRFRLETVSTTTGNPISQIEPGEEFILEVYVEDLTNSGGVYAAYLDIEYDENLVSPEPISTTEAAVDFNDRYADGRETPRGGIVPENIGQLNEFGGYGGASNNFTDEDPNDNIHTVKLAEVKFKAIAAGTLQFTSNEADIVPRNEVLLASNATTVDPSRILYGSTSELVVSPPPPFTNPENRFDVDNNGFVTARDALILINDINSVGARRLAAASTGSDAPTSFYLDVSQDGNLSPIDVLQVINKINEETAQANARVAAAAAVDALFAVNVDEDDEDNDEESEV